MNFKNETEIQCYLYKNEDFITSLISKIINELIGVKIKKEDISYYGVEVPIKNVKSSYGNSYKRIDMLYKLKDICYIPLELKTQNYVGSALTQAKEYSDLLFENYGKKSIIGIVANHITKPEKERINRQHNAFWIEFETMTYGIGVGD